MDAKRKKIEERLRTSQSSFSKKRKFQTITNLSTAINDLGTTVDGRLFQLRFPEAPVDFVGMMGHQLAAIREEPGQTLIREYIDAHIRPQIKDIELRVQMEVKEVVRDLFDEKPQQAESRLVEFLKETCIGDHHDAKPFMQHLQPFDIQASTLVRMLDGIYQQGKGQAAQLTELRNQNIELTRQTKRQFQDQADHHAELHAEHTEQLKILEIQSKQQSDKLDKLLMHAEREDDTLVECYPMDDESVDPPSNQTYTKVPPPRTEERKAFNQSLAKILRMGDKQATKEDQLTPDEVLNKLSEHNIRLPRVSLGKILSSMGVCSQRNHLGGSKYTTKYQFIKFK